MIDKLFSHKNPNILFWMISTCLLILPFFFTTFVPSTDLPQHLCQIQELNGVLDGSNTHLTINWFAPNNLIYILLFIVCIFFKPFIAGKVAVIIIMILWSSAIFYLAKTRNRPIENAVIASLICYNFSLYWGLLNFLIGFPVYILFITESNKPLNKKRWVIILSLSFLLFLAHALWFLIGGISLGIITLIHWETWKTSFTKISSLIPVGMIAAFWYPTLAATRKGHGADVSAHWINSFFSRLTPGYLSDTLLGGLKGPSEIIVSSVVLTWVGLSIYTHRKNLSPETDKSLLACSLLLIGIMLLAPETYMNTLFFSKRWFPIGIIILIMALPAPVFNNKFPVTWVAIAILIFLSVNTARYWCLFENKELTGLKNAIGMLPEEKKIIGLDFVKSSQFIKNRPFLQLFAYSQAVKNGYLNFSFTEHASGIVRYKIVPEKKWTPGLEWFPERVSHKDFKYFDYALVNGKTDFHSKISAFKYLIPVTSTGRFRLYEIDKDKISRK